MKKLYAAIDQKTHLMSDTFGVIAEYDDMTLERLLEDVAPRIPHRLWKDLDIYCIGEVDENLNVTVNDYHLVDNLETVIMSACRTIHTQKEIIENLNKKEEALS